MLCLMSPVLLERFAVSASSSHGDTAAGVRRYERSQGGKGFWDAVYLTVAILDIFATGEL
ncbi:hypothetical protein EYF80_028579 [Liparis tanakae]|uniref:Uncharacterized protein n=1 Tax=Liparis tanakae TaxID=230148 RepID=A0A4Z2H8K8_9TELE|nr:hypothetical protein EYF80_028579 [Liparis tanakae]